MSSHITYVNFLSVQHFTPNYASTLRLIKTCLCLQQLLPHIRVNVVLSSKIKKSNQIIVAKKNKKTKKLKKEQGAKQHQQSNLNIFNFNTKILQLRFIKKYSTTILRKVKNEP